VVELDDSSAPQRVLVIRLGAIGDVVRTRFAVDALRARFPRAELDWLVEDRVAAALDGAVGLRVVRVRRAELRARRPLRALRALVALARELRARRYDLAIDFHGVLKSGLLAWLSRAPDRVGYAPPFAREASWIFLTRRVRLDAPHVSRFERNAALVDALGGEALATSPRVELPSDAVLAAEGVPGGFVAMHPGTSASTRYKRWELARFAALARSLRDALGLETLVTAGPDRAEREAAEAVVAASSGAARLAPATPTLAHLLALYGRARVFVGNDSGPMHVASLAGLPVVAIFGPTDPVENAPLARGAERTLWRDVGCNPCREGCPARACLDAVDVESVLAAVRALVARAPAVP
jgi:ADP-heptose:LPS heptosyltransferase